jgi:hypothetical protein
MGEIKSTMDIIMEKTKGLSMSEEEKAEYRQQELRGKVRGLIRKFLDGILDLDELKAEVDLLSDYPRGIVEEAIIEESVPHMELGKDNDPIYRVFEETLGMNSRPVLDIEGAYLERLEREKKVFETSLKEKIKEKGISGSAVIPNLKADPAWKQFLSDQNEAFRAQISSHCLKTE